MPTPDMSDEELDALVRRSAEAYPEEIPLGGWLQMETKLSEAATAQLLRRKIARFFALEVVVVGLLLLLWQGYRVLNPTPEAARQPSRDAQTLGSRRGPATSPASVAPRRAGSAPGVATTKPVLSAPAPAAGGVAETPANSVQAAAAPTAAAAGSSSVSQLGQRTSPFAAGWAASSRRKSTRFTEGSLLAVSRPAFSTTGQHAEVLGSQLPTNPEIPTSPAAAPAAAMPDQTKPEAAPAAAPTTPPTPVALPSPALDTLARQPAALPADSTASQRSAPARPDYRLVVGVLGSPSVSAVRTLGTARLGSDLGLTVEYRLTARLRVRTGLIRSVRRYTAASTDYTIPADWLDWRQGDYEVEANCRITEIPLDLRYDAVSRPAYTLFAGVGLTSLLMRNERYDYEYYMNGRRYSPDERVIVNGPNHVFGVLRLSGGVEHSFGGHWGVQAEPFWQLPLGEVGTGKVRLSSAGAAFSLKYGLLR